MDLTDFQEKMDPQHKSFFCRMLGVEVLPDCLLEKYRGLKSMTDHIDGHLYVGDLAIIALLAGYNPDTKKFPMTEAEEKGAAIASDATNSAVETDEPPEQATKEELEQQIEQLKEKLAATTEGIDTSLQELADKHAAEPEKQTAEQAEHAAEQAAKPPVSGVTGQAASEQPEQSLDKPQSEDEPSESTKFWSLGMPVNVLQEGELKQGEIVGVDLLKPDSEQVRQLTIKLKDGETVTVDEDEVEAD